MKWKGVRDSSTKTRRLPEKKGLNNSAAICTRSLQVRKHYSVLTFYGRPVSYVEARGGERRVPREVQRHDNSSQQLDARHRAIPAEGANVDCGHINTAVDVVANKIWARLSWFNLS